MQRTSIKPTATNPARVVRNLALALMSHMWRRPAHNGVLLLQSVATEIALLLALYGASSLQAAHPRVEPKAGVHAALFVASIPALACVLASQSGSDVSADASSKPIAAERENRPFSP